jgi:hypothetical protein
MGNLMESIFSILRTKLKEYIKIEFDDRNRTVYLWVKSKQYSEDIIGTSDEVKVMLIIFGGLRETTSVNIEVNNDSKIIKIITEIEEEYTNLKSIMSHIWDDTIDLLEQVNVGDLSKFQTIKYEDN